MLSIFGSPIASGIELAARRHFWPLLLPALVLPGTIAAGNGPASAAELAAPPLSEPSTVVPPRAPTTMPAAPGFTLAGTIVSPTVRRALIARGDSGTLEHVVEGEKIEGWEFEKILADGVILRHNTERVELKLRESLPGQADAASPAPAAATAVPATPAMTHVLEPAEAEALFFAAHGIKDQQ